MSSSSIVATLEPIHPQSHEEKEELQTGFFRHEQRRALQIRHNHASAAEDGQHVSNTLVLGRNETTGIRCDKVAKRAISIRWNYDNAADHHGQGCFLSFDRHSHHCSILQENSNGGYDVVTADRGMLLHGTVIRLYEHQYAYRVKLMMLSTTTSATTATAAATTAIATATTTTASSQLPSFKETAEECMCPICMEILVDTTALVPCGHLLCGDCAATKSPLHLTECPTCRQSPLTSTLKVKGMDNVVRTLVQSASVFSQCDVEHYWKRTKPAATEAAVAKGRAGMASPPKRARRAGGARRSVHRAATTTTTTLAPTTRLANSSTAATATAPPAVVAVDLTITPPRAGGNAGDTAEAAICID